MRGELRNGTMSEYSTAWMQTTIIYANAAKTNMMMRRRIYCAYYYCTSGNVHVQEKTESKYI
jgi:hypothetical protein